MFQAQIVSRKKEAAAEALNDARNELHSLKAELAEKQQQLRDSDNQGMLKPDEVMYNYIFSRMCSLCTQTVIP